VVSLTDGQRSHRGAVGHWAARSASAAFAIPTGCDIFPWWVLGGV